MNVNRLLIPVTIALAVLLPSCGEESANAPENNLCPGATGMGVRITGRAVPVDMCVPDDRVQGNVETGVQAIYTVENRYHITAHFTQGDTEFELRLIFGHQQGLPTRVTSNFADAEQNSDAAWLYYKEIPGAGDTIESVSVSGTINVSFCDDQITVGSLAGVNIGMEKVSDQTAAGQRAIPTGFFSLSVDP